MVITGVMLIVVEVPDLICHMELSKVLCVYNVISVLLALENFKGLILNTVSLDDDLVPQDDDYYTTVEASLPSLLLWI